MGSVIISFTIKSIVTGHFFVNFIRSMSPYVKIVRIFVWYYRGLSPLELHTPQNN